MATVYYKIYIEKDYADSEGNPVPLSNAATFTTLEEVATFAETYLTEGEYLVRSFVLKS